jgi:8-oxo-dGTP diphosphatase
MCHPRASGHRALRCSHERPHSRGGRVIRDRSGRLLVVGKRGTTAFMQPGGKIAANEGALAALAREVLEELGPQKLASARYLGRFAAPAANEASERVLADLYAVELEGDVMPAAGMEEAAWLNAAVPGPIGCHP